MSHTDDQVPAEPGPDAPEEHPSSDPGEALPQEPVTTEAEELEEPTAGVDSPATDAAQLGESDSDVVEPEEGPSPSPSPIPILSTPPADPLAPMDFAQALDQTVDPEAPISWDERTLDQDKDESAKSAVGAGAITPDREESVTDAIPTGAGEDANSEATAIIPAVGLSEPELAEQKLEEPVAAASPKKRTEDNKGKGLKGATPKKKKGVKAFIWAVVVLLVLAGAYVGAQWFVSDNVARGTTVANVEIGGLSTTQATAKLQDNLGAVVSTPIGVSAQDLSTQLTPSEAGVEFDAPATIAGLTDFTLDPRILWAHITGGSEIEPVVHVDDETLDGALEQLAASLLTEPVDGTVGFENNEAVMTEAVDGTAVDVEATKALFLEELFTANRPLQAPVTAVSPEITAEVTQQAYERAQTIASGPVTVSVDSQDIELPVDAFVPLASVSVEDSELVISFDGEELTQEIIDRTEDLFVSPKNAHFTFEDGKPTIVAGKPGTSIDPDEAAQSFLAAASTSERVAPVELMEKDPEQGVAELEALGVKEKVSSFSTNLVGSAARTQNLVVAAGKITGTLILPGEEFDLTKVIGPITAANGYQNAGVVVNGIHQDGMGGGLSQMSTTAYNAGFFAGMVDVEHRPHSYHFTRYPEGRESTMFVGSINMVWRNDSPHGVLMRSYVAGGQLTVEAWSTKTYEVETTTSGRYNVVPATTVNSTAANCAPVGRGNPGFGVTVTRKVTEIASGKVVIDEKNSWTYRPDNGITCNKPAPKTETETTDSD